MKTLLIFLLLTTTAIARPFTIEQDFREAPVEINLAPSMVATEVGNFFLHVNTEIGTASPDCEIIAVGGGCLSVLEWAERNVTELLYHYPFQEYLHELVKAQLVDQDLSELGLNLPLFGKYNINLTITDLWNNTGCADDTSGPLTLNRPYTRIGCVFNDNDTEAIPLLDALQRGNWNIDIYARGLDNNAAIDPSYLTEGSIGINITFDYIEFDIILNQPLEPQLSIGVYSHAAGKLRLSNVDLTVEISSFGGDLVTPFSSGYGIGIDLEYLRVYGEIDFDLNAFDCTYQGYCNAANLPAIHALYNNQSKYEYVTNNYNEAVADFIKFIELDVFLEAQKVVGSLAQKLSAVQVLDTRDFSHETSEYNKPEFAHPFGDSVEWDYGFSYNFNAGLDQSVNVFGGLGMDFVYDSPCVIPIPPDPRYTALPYNPETEQYVKRDQSMISAGIHVNALNSILDNLTKSGVLCAQIFPDNSLLGDLMTFETLEKFLPRISDKYSGQGMMLELTVRYDSPSGSSVSPPFFSFGDTAPPDLLDGNNPRPFDLQFSIPHLVWTLYVDADTTSYESYTPLFSFETEFNLYLGLGWYKLVSGNAEWSGGLDGTVCDSPDAPCNMLRLSAHLDNDVKRINMAQLNDYLDPKGLEQSVDALSVLLLDGVYQGLIEIALNLDPLLGVTLTSGNQYASGTSEYIGDLLEPFDFDGDGVYEYLGISLRINDNDHDGYADIIDPEVWFYLLNQSGLLPDVDGVTIEKPLLSPSYEIEPNTFYEVIGNTLRLSSDIEVSHYVYRFNGGVDRIAYDKINIPNLPDNVTIEIQAVSTTGVIDGSPERYTYVAEPEKQIEFGCTTNRSGYSFLLMLLFACIGYTYYHKTLDF